jgi:SAM-dependent methyltransferase
MSDDAQTPGAGSGDPIPPEARTANLALWNHWTEIHEKSAFYDVEGFKAGATSLWPVERKELEPYVHEGTSLLHLQCHFGLDTLSWARLGAEVVGLDLSDEAIALARRLAAEVGLSARAEFVCADLYDTDAHLGVRRFDVVFVSWGAIEWLPDLTRWAGIIARHLRPGGTFYLAEIHPFGYSLDEVPGEHDVQVKYRLQPAPDQPDVEPIDGSYADRDADTTGLVAYAWQHSLAEVTGALIGAGLRIEHLHEFPASPAPFWEWMVQDEDRWWWLPDGEGGLRKDLPLSYSLRATRPTTEAG